MTKMNLKSLALPLLLAFPITIVAADDLPKPFTFARYQKMMDRSPFAVATAVTAPASAPNFAKDLYVANAAHNAKEDLVTIASSTDKNFKKYLTTTGAVDGYSISSIEWSDKVGSTTVTIAKDGQTATLGFNEALLKPAAPGNPGSPPIAQQQAQDKNGAVPPPPAAMIPGAQPNMTKPMPVPSLPTPPPRARGVIPRNPANSSAPQPKS